MPLGNRPRAKLHVRAYEPAGPNADPERNPTVTGSLEGRFDRDGTLVQLW